MAKAIAVEGCEFKDLTGGGTCTLLSGKSTKVKAEGKYVLLDGAKVQVAGGKLSGLPQTKPVTCTINSTATKVKADGTLVLLVDDVSDAKDTNAQATYQAGSSSTTAIVVVQITDAGQGSVKGL